MKKLPIGVQNIYEIIHNDQVYVDKTGHAKRLIDQGKHNFMSRPRRFGKSLFIDTLKEIFEGNKELFKSYAIYESNYSWQKFPVICFDFAKLGNTTSQELENDLKIILVRMMRSHGISFNEPTASIQVHLDVLIEELAKQKGPVVVLVDEYDKPIIDQLHDLDLVHKNRAVLQGFFGALKSLDRHLRFTFVAGISKFAQVSLFSTFNNLIDLTMNPEFADMMGYTEAELKVYFAPHMQAIAKKRSQQSGLKVAEEDVLEQVREWYNGYRFSESDIRIYNPFSTLNFLKNGQVKGYWYSTGTPSFLINQLKKHSQSMISLDGTKGTEEELMDISNLEQISLSALMYQTGYFTIQGYNPHSKRYDLGFPNEEVRTAFINSLVKTFASITSLRSSQAAMESLGNYQPEPLFKHIEAGFSTFDYRVFAEAKEHTYQLALLSMLYGMGCDPLAERGTNTGRIDIVFEMATVVYIMELKLNSSAEAALKQIHEKKYYNSYTYKGKKILIIGANFSSKDRNISEWKGELLSESGEKIKDILPQ